VGTVDGVADPGADSAGEELTGVRAQVHDTRRPVITCYPDGPLLVRGDVDLVDVEGRPLPRRRRTFALCRCGKSGLAPLCDGTHKQIGFSAPGSLLDS